MLSNGAGGPAQGSGPKLAALGMIMAVLMAVLVACGGSGHGGAPAPPPITSGPASPPTTSPANLSEGGSPPTTQATAPGAAQSLTTSPTTSRNPYRQFDQNVARLLKRRAAWRAPQRIKVDQTARVGLVIGDPGLLKAQIKQLVPGAFPKPAGTVQVGSTISVQLLADPNDASVTPNAAIDESLGEHTALLWTWYVNAKHPNAGLLLTAEITTKMSDGQVLYKELALTIPVDRTIPYTLYQIFTSWATWAAIVAALAGTAGWIRRKRKKRHHNKRAGEKPKNRKRKSPQTQP